MALRGAGRPRALRALLVASVALAAAQPGAAQRAAAVLDRDTATVGDVVRVAVRVLPAAAGAPVSFPPALDLPDDVEAAGPVEVSVDSVAPFGVTAVYPVTPWRPGDLALGVLTVRLSDGATLPVTLPTLHVVSVLPADTAGVEARPPRDVVGPGRLWWPLLVALLAAVLAAALGWWLWRRRRGEGQADGALSAPRDPREEALEALDAVARLPLDGTDAIKFFHARLTVALRRYAAAVDGAWGAELTTTELAARARLDHGAAPLLDLLGRADLVKFARRAATATAAQEELASARAWVASWPPPPLPTATDEAEAPRERVA